MNAPTLTCQNENRRHEVRKTRERKDEKQRLNGLDYVTVSENQLELKVFLLDKVQSALATELRKPNAKKRVLIQGGRRIRDIAVTDIVLETPQSENEDDRFVINVNKFGDFSTYTLRLVELDESDHPTDKPMAGFDARYAHLQFSFKEECPSDLDCKTEKICPPPERIQPEINYLAKDYASFRRLILDRLAQIMPDWKERHVPDLGITLVELLAYVGDHLSYYQDAVATEAYLDTARQRISVRRHVRLVDYAMHEGCNARTWIHIQIAAAQNYSLDLSKAYFITLPQTKPERGVVLNHEELRSDMTLRYEVFEPLLPKDTIFKIRHAHNVMHFYNWGDSECCLPRGATSATLRDEWDTSTKATMPRRKLKLQVDDFLIFEEVKGAKTGATADANPNHRHVVRLTAVEKNEDPVYRDQTRDLPTPVLEIAWDREDALPFPLCISGIGPAPECELLTDISVVYGNVLLVDHGRREEEDLGRVGIKTETLECVCEGKPEDAVLAAETFTRQLKRGPLTFGQVIPAGLPAKKLLQQEPALAAPQIVVECSCVVPGGIEKTLWLPQADLLRSESEDNHFVVEMDNDAIAHLRFGDGQSGRKPEVGEHFQAIYRYGNGVAGNIGAESLTHVVLRGVKETVRLTPRNPLPATGGIEPEPLAEVKLFAPTAFRNRLERAITPEDYARLAERDPRVQRAAATLRWTGSWYEMLVALDPFGTVTDEAELLHDLKFYLERFRRMGHDLVVARAQYVPLDVRMEICVRPGHLRGHVKAELLKIFSSQVLADGTLGFFHRDNFTFGEGVRLSNIYAAAQAVPGVESVNITRFERLFQGPNKELEDGFLPIYPLEIAQLDNDPSFPENGRLELLVAGGR